MHAEIGQQILGVHHDVEQMRHRRALIAADIAHARLKERLGDGKDALAAKRLAGAEPQRIHFFLERAFHPSSRGSRLRYTYIRFCRSLPSARSRRAEHLVPRDGPVRVPTEWRAGQAPGVRRRRWTATDRVSS